MKKRRRPRPVSGEVLEGMKGGKFRAVLIREGKSKNGNVWPRAVLEKMVEILEGIPIHLYDASGDGSRRLLQHWETWRQRLRRVLPPGLGNLLPERFENATVAAIRNAEVVENDGVAEIQADLEPDKDRGGLLQAIARRASDLGRKLGLSIHAPADGVKTKELTGGSREVLEVTRVVGFDVVSFPSAGGRVVPVLEALARRSPAMKWKDLLMRLFRLVPEDRKATLEEVEKLELDEVSALLEEEHEEHRQALREALDLGEEIEDEALPAVLEALAKTVKVEPKKPAKKSRRKTSTKRQTDDDEGNDDLDSIAESVAAQNKVLEKILVDQGADLIESIVNGEKLPEETAKFVKAQLTATLEANGTISRKEISEFVDSFKKAVRPKATAGSLLEGDQNHGHVFSQDWSSGERVEAALEAMIANEPFGILVGEDGKKTKVPRFRSLKESYQVITGDFLLEGSDFFFGNRRRLPHNPVLESLDREANPFWLAWHKKVGGALTEAAKVSADYSLLLSNLMHKRLLKEYATLRHVWRMIARTVPVADFKQRNVIQYGEFGQLAAVDEGGTGSTGYSTGYVELTYPSEDDITATITKYGGLALFSWESIINDDLKKIQRTPGMMARAAERTLNTLVWGKILNNSNIYDGTALFTSGHGNLVSLAYAWANVKTMRKQMTRQKDLDDMEAGRFTPKTLFVGPEKIDEAYEDVGSSGKAQLSETGEIGTAGSADRSLSSENAGKPNVLRTRYGLQVEEVHEFDEVSGADDNYYLAADPQVVDQMEVGFLNGQEDPSLFVSDLSKAGSMFDDDVITWKIRHAHDGGVVTDFRGFQGGIAP